MALARRPLEVVALVVLAACGPAGPNPDQGRCDTPAATADVSELELGHGEDGAFRPFVDGEVAALVTGGQGITMVPLRLRARGAAVPACFDLDLRALPGGVGDEPLASSRSGLALAGTDTERVSDTAFFITDFLCRGSPFRVRAQGYGRTVEHTVYAASTDGLEIVALRSVAPSYRVGDTIELELETSLPTAGYGIDLTVDGAYRGATPTGTTTTTTRISLTADHAGTVAVEVSVSCQRAHLDVPVT